METGEVYILNWIKYNPVNNANIIKRVLSELSEVKSREFFDEFCKGLPRGLQGATKGLIRGYQAPTKEPTPTPTPTSLPTPTPGDDDESEPVDSVDNVDNSKGENPEAGPVPFSKIKDEWNKTCFGFPSVRDITEKRRPQVRARWKQFGEDINAFKIAFAMLQNSEFCKGENPRGWTASFDWIMENDTNMVKVLENKYQNRASPVTQHKPPNAFHNFKEGPPDYTEEEMKKLLKEINGLE